MPRIHPRWQLAQCELEELPALIGGFYLLRLLDLSENKLEELGKKHFKLIERLDNTNSEIGEVKNEIKRFRQSGANNSSIRKKLAERESADNDNS